MSLLDHRVGEELIRMSKKTNPPPNEELDKLAESFYIWCMDTVTDSYKLDRIPGLGEANKLSPSEFKAALRQYFLEQVLELIGDDFKYWGKLFTEEQTIESAKNDLRRGLREEARRLYG